MSTRHYEGHRKTRTVMREHYPRFSDAEYERRYGLVRGLMDEHDLQCLLLYGDSALNSLQSLNCHWLSNYFDEQCTYVIVPRTGDPILYTSIPADVPAAMAASPIDDVRPGGVGRGMAQTVAGDLAKLGPFSRVGLVDNFATAPGLPWVHHQTLTAALPGTEIVPVAREYEQLKQVPSAEEMEWFRRGVELTDVAWERLAEAVEPGRTEAELLAIVHDAYLAEGGSYCFAILGSTPMADPALSYPHAIPGQASRRPLESGDYILCELSASYYGYSGQNFCAVTLGEPTPELAEMAALSKEVHDELATAIRAGSTDADVGKATARIRERGFDMIAPAVHAWGTHFGHPVIGHESWSPWPVTFESGQLVVIQPHVCAPDATLGFEIGALGQVGADGTAPLHRHGTELVVKN